MAKQTISAKIISDMTAQGYTLKGRTTGLFSFHKSSKLTALINRLGLTPETCEVRAAARAGKHANDGYQLLVFTK